MKLSLLPPGQLAVVREFLQECSTCERLAALGLLPGTRIRITHVAPLGDPITVQMPTQAISLRRQEAEHLEVEVIGS